MSWRDKAKPVTVDGADSSWRSRAKPVAQSDEIIQEMHPKISLGTRALLQNLGNDKGQENELKKLGLEVKRSANGQLIVRSPGETQYRVMDPDTGMISKDTLNDVTDGISDIGDGIAGTVGSAGGALLGALGGTAVAPGVGTVAGGMTGGALGGGIAGAGYEAGRQSLGKLAGIDQEVDGTDVAISGGAGAVSPLLFGSGMGVKQGAKAVLAGDAAKASLKKALGMSASEKLTQAAAENLAKQAERGAGQWVWQGVKSAAPSVAGYLSGKGKNSINYLANNMGYVDSFKDDVAVQAESDRLTPLLGKQVKDHRRSMGAQYGADIKSIGQPVDIDPAMELFRSRIKELESIPENLKSEGTRDKIKTLQTAYDKLFSTAQAPDGSAKLYFPGKVDAPTAQSKMQDLKHFMRLRSGEGVGGNAASDVSGVNQVAEQAWGSMKDGIDTAGENVASGSRDKFKEAIALERLLKPGFKDSPTTLKTLKGLDKDGRISTRAALAKAEERGITAAGDMGNFSEAINWYKPSLKTAGVVTLDKIPGATIGAGIGYMAGANSGMGQGAAGVGGVGGGIAGSAIFGPAAIKNYTKLAIKSGQAKEAAENFIESKTKGLAKKQLLATPMAKSVWEQMKKDDEE